MLKAVLSHWARFNKWSAKRAHHGSSKHVHVSPYYGEVHESTFAEYTVFIINLLYPSV